MRYKDDQVVLVKDKEGRLVGGVLTGIADFPGEVMWWVKYQDASGVEISLVTEEQLDEWNVPKDRCVCGSSAVKHPGHSFYCSLFSYSQ